MPRGRCEGTYQHCAMIIEGVRVEVSNDRDLRNISYETECTEWLCNHDQNIS